MALVGPRNATNCYLRMLVGAEGAATGRAGELCGLHVDDINLDRHVAGRRVTTRRC
jgi:hypothetical protein